MHGNYPELLLMHCCFTCTVYSYGHIGTVCQNDHTIPGQAGRPKAALLFWFFGGFRCGVPLFIVIL